MAVAAEADRDEGGTDDTLNFFCRLPPDRAKGIERKTTPPPMTWLRRILDTYDQPVAQMDGQGKQASEKSTGAVPQMSRDRKQTDSSSISSASMYGGPSSRASDTGTTTYYEPEEQLSLKAAEEEEEEEAPWFSQLANHPQVRSAGVPFVAATSSIPIANRSKEVNNGGSSNARRANTAHSAGSLGRSAGSDMYGFAVATSSSASSVAADQSGVSYSTVESTSINSSRSSLLHVPPNVNSGNGSAGLSQASAPSAAAPLTKSTAPLDPPDNFAMVNSWVYRSSFPKKRHFPFLQSLKLKSVLTLILEEYPEQNMKFLDDNGITFFQFGIPGNKEPFVQIPHEKITAALVTIMDRRNHPMLIHCNKGKHRTGCLIGCLRKLQQWSLSTIFDEYRRFSFPKSRSMDQEFIELYREQVVWAKVQDGMLPRWAVLGKRIRTLTDGEEEDIRLGRLQHGQSNGQSVPPIGAQRQIPRITGM